MNTVLSGFTWLLVLQLAGEAIVRLTGVALPGPIVGFLLALGALGLAPALRAPLRAAADALLPHLSLLFIPAGVGVVMYLSVMREDALAIGAALVFSTLAGLAATAWVAERVARWQDGRRKDAP
ncbi:MAG: CidA/LrgA family protein [Casimicrobiaceae bacterium]